MTTLSSPERVIRSVLIDAATGKFADPTLSYRELGDEVMRRGFTGPYPMVDPPFRGLGEALGNISEYEHVLGRPLLSAIVVTESSRLPGNGFVKMAKVLGRAIDPDADTFCGVEQENVSEFWGDPDLASRLVDAAFGQVLDLLRQVRRDQRRIIDMLQP